MPQNFCLMDDSGGSTASDEPSTTAAIAASVGDGGANRPADVMTVQMLLNEARLTVGTPSKLLAVDGVAGRQTVAAIREFQQSQLGFSDGRVDPGRKTLARLNAVLAGLVPVVVGGGATVEFGATFLPVAANSPKQTALDTVPLAQFWASMALMHVNGLIGVVQDKGIFFPDLGINVTDLVAFRVANTHFHLDRDP